MTDQAANDSWPHRRVIQLHCAADACRQGEIPCPVPDACGVAEDDDHQPNSPAAALGFWLLVLFLVLGFFAGWFWHGDLIKTFKEWLA